MKQSIRRCEKSVCECTMVNTRNPTKHKFLKQFTILSANNNNNNRYKKNEPNGKRGENDNTEQSAAH